MNIRLYKVLDIERCDMGNGNDVMDAVCVMTEEDLRKEFKWLIDNKKIPVELWADYKREQDYSKENWEDLESLSIGTIIDIMNDIENYTCGEGYYILETDVKVEMSRAEIKEQIERLGE